MTASKAVWTLPVEFEGGLIAPPRQETVVMVDSLYELEVGQCAPVDGVAERFPEDLGIAPLPQPYEPDRMRAHKEFHRKRVSKNYYGEMVPEPDYFWVWKRMT